MNREWTFLWVVTALCLARGCVAVPEVVLGDFDESRLAVTQHRLDRLADRAADWQALHSTTIACPTVGDLEPGSDVNDAWGNRIVIVRGDGDDDHSRPRIRSAGEDGQFGTGDDLWDHYARD